MTIENNDLPPKNRGGRPKGSRTKSRSEKLLDRLANSRGDNLGKIIDGVMALAQNGEKWAAEAIMDRMWPAPKGRPLQVRMPVGMGLAGIAAGFDAILEAINAGNITASERAELASILRQQADVLEAKDIEQRIANLEQANIGTP
jgi:hypothetical protein